MKYLQRISEARGLDVGVTGMNREIKWREDWNIEIEELNRTISPTSRDAKAALNLGSNVGDSRHISESLGRM